MNALIDQDATAGQFRVITPVLCVVRAASLAVDPAYEVEVAHRAGVNQLLGFFDGIMHAVVETEFQHQSGVCGFGFAHAPDILRVAPWGLFREYVLAAGKCFAYHIRDHHVGYAADDHIRIVIIYSQRIGDHRNSGFRIDLRITGDYDLKPPVTLPWIRGGSDPSFHSR